MQVMREMFATIPDFIRDTYGPEALEKWYKTLKPELASVMKSKKSKEVWYDSTLYFIEPLKKTGELFFNGDTGEAARAHGIYDMKRWFSGIRALILKLLPIRFVIENIFPSVLHNYYRIVDVKQISYQDGFTVFAVLGLESHEEAIIKKFAASMEVFLTEKGYSGFRVETALSNNNVKPYSVIEVRWLTQKNN